MNLLLCYSITLELLQVLKIQNNIKFFELLRQKVKNYKQDYHPEVI